MGGKGEGLALVSRRLRPRSPQSPTRGLTQKAAAIAQCHRPGHSRLSLCCPEVCRV